MTIFEAKNYLLSQLKNVYDEQELRNISDWVLEEITHYSKSKRLIYKEEKLSVQQENQLRKCTDDLLKHTPVQYVFGYAYFMGMKFLVDENVLIPRPETEELVNWIINLIKEKKYLSINILDIGTGSGIIPISIKKKYPDANISAIEISSEALNVAKQNAENNHTEIDFFQMNILNENEWSALKKFDIIVSNPPYIAEKEKALMHKNVLDFEPHLALFVPDENPLIFYEKIISLSKNHLNENGFLFFEINESFGKETVELLQRNNFSEIELKKDLQGKDRMVKAMFKK